MSPAAMEPMTASSEESALISHFSDLRGVLWRIYLGVLPSDSSSSIDDLRRVTADTRRRYAGLRRRLLVDPQIQKDGSSTPNLAIDNPLSQNPDSMWGRFFRNAELEKVVDQDLSRLYPEHGSYFQTAGCQGVLRRILLIWCLRNPEYGYRQGMHELLAPLVYVLHSDLRRLSEVRKLYEEHFTDKLDDIFFHEGDFTYNFDFRRSLDSTEGETGFQEKSGKVVSLDELDPSIQTIIHLCDAYGAEGELGILLSEKFMEHDAYCMFDALMSGAGGAVAMAEFFYSSPVGASQTGIAPVIEASSALYHLLSIVDPSLHSHLIELGVEPQYFALRWLRVLFGREFSLEDLLVIWDHIFEFDNVKSGKDAESDFGLSSGILNSPRGAFISSMAVAMMLNVRSSLLATENATSCLQRLLNFPENIDLNKLIIKAKSLMTVERNAHKSPMIVGQYGCSNSPVVRAHSHSFDSSPAKTPVSSLPERYWEEKWRVLHDEEETKENLTKKTSSQIKGWTHRVKLRLSRTESDPSPSKREDRPNDSKSSIRRRLLEDLSQHLYAGDDKESGCVDSSNDDPHHAGSLKKLHSGNDINELGHNESFSCEDPLGAGFVTKNRAVPENLGCIVKTGSSETVGTEENSATLSGPISPSSDSNCTENPDTQKCNGAPSRSHNVNDGEVHNASLSQSAESPLPISDSPDIDVPLTDSVTGPSTMVSRERKSISGKFLWLWKFGRNAPSEGPSDNAAAVEGRESSNGVNVQSDISARERNHDPGNLKVDTTDQNLLCTLRSLGQSMLENIQVVESVFQPDRGQGGSAELSKNALVGKGQVTALSALKELRKISNILSEM